MQSSDELYAAKLQQKFDEEERKQKEIEEEDNKLALALSLGHDISGSDEDENIFSSNKNNCRQSKVQSRKKNSPNISDKYFAKESNSKKTVTHETKSVLEISDSDSDEGCSKKAQRHDNKRDTKPHCEYGKRCYRKNPVHRQEFYHSGSDSDEEVTNPKEKKRQKVDSKHEQSSSQRMKESSSQHSTINDVLQAATPFSFLMSKVTGIPSKYNNDAVHISELLSPAMGDLEASVQFNYCHDIPWLMQQYHPKFRSKPLLLVHGEQRESKNALHEEASTYPNIKLCQARLEIMYGTHHSKMMILLYKEGMRVVIHTANLLHSDWHQKSQGVWISPLFPKLSNDLLTPEMGNSSTNFKVDLLEYIAAYKMKELTEWRQHILQHDMSEARVHIIASVPGRHQGENRFKWGHFKLRKVLHEHAGTKVKNWSVIGQFSSVGSLGPDKTKWLCGEWLESLSSSPSGRTSNPSHLKLIFPSVDNVRLSLEGYPAGASIPYHARTAVKQPYFNNFLHQWCSSVRGRTRASPHIKTYTKVSPDQSRISWFLVTSANLSKAAWGALEKKETQLMIRSYEIGVLFLPKDFNPGDGDCFSVDATNNDSEELYFPLPWDLPLKQYEAKDSPWIWDIAHAEKPDCHGNAWIPS